MPKKRSGLNVQMSLGRRCLKCAGLKRVEVCNKCGATIQKVDAYPKLEHCIVCGCSGRPVERKCPQCQ